MKNRRGLALSEVLVACLIGLLAFLGTMLYQYYGAYNAKQADTKNTASRLGCMLLENWKGTGARVSYDPLVYYQQSMEISDSDVELENKLENVCGTYHINLYGIDFYAVLSYRDTGVQNPRLISVSVAWTNDGLQWDTEKGCHYVSLSSYTEADI